MQKEVDLARQQAASAATQTVTAARDDHSDLDTSAQMESSPFEAQTPPRLPLKTRIATENAAATPDFSCVPCSGAAPAREGLEAAERGVTDLEDASAGAEKAAEEAEDRLARVSVCTSNNVFVTNLLHRKQYHVHAPTVFFFRQ